MRPALFILALLPALLLLPLQESRPSTESRTAASGPWTEQQSQQYLMMQPIQESLKSGDFSRLQKLCWPKVSVNLEGPFRLQGYYARQQFIHDFSKRFERYRSEKIEWGSMQVEENLAVQSLNIILLDQGSRREVFYKLIFFMVKEKEWKLYYLRGLRL